MLGVHVRGDAARLLGVGRDVQRQRGLARGLRPEDLGDAAARDAPDADGGVEVDGPRRDGVHLHPRALGAHPHDGPLAAGLLDLRDGEVERLAAVFVGVGGHANLR